MEKVDKSNQAWKADFIGELNKRIDSKADDWWDEVRNGSNCKSKWLAIEICHILAYYDQYLTEARLSTIFKVRPNNHNTKLALEKLMEVRVLTSTTDNEGAEVYGLVATLQMHLQYKSNSAIENSIRVDLKRLYNEGHTTINARKKRKRGNNIVNDDREHGDNGIQNGNDKEDGDEDVQSLDSDEDNDSAGQQSTSEEEDDSTGQQSTSEEEEDENAREEDEEEDPSILEV